VPSLERRWVERSARAGRRVPGPPECSPTLSSIRPRSGRAATPIDLGPSRPWLRWDGAHTDAVAGDAPATSQSPPLCPFSRRTRRRWWTCPAAVRLTLTI